MDNEYEQKLRKEFNELAPYLKDDDTDRVVLIDWKRNIREYKSELSDSFLREFADYLDPADLFNWKINGNVNFIREMKQAIYFLFACFMYKKVDEKFILEFGRPTLQIERMPINDEGMLIDLEKSIWRQIAKNQTLSYEFIKKNWERIDWEELAYFHACNINRVPEGLSWEKNFENFKRMIKE